GCDDADRALRPPHQQDAMSLPRAGRDRALDADAVLRRTAPHGHQLVDLVVRLRDRLALVEGADAGELVPPRLADVRDPPERGGALERGGRRPPREGVARGID